MKWVMSLAVFPLLMVGCQTATLDSGPDTGAMSPKEAAPETGGEEREFVERLVSYELDGTRFESTIVHEADAEEPMPGILMVPNWMGPTEASLEKARDVADEGWVVMMVDMYGVDVRPRNSAEAGEAAGVVRADREMMRARMSRAQEVFLGEAGIPLDPDSLAAIGFCFGGGTVLEYARSGAELDAVVSFHGDLASPTLEADTPQIRSKVLVLHGADDPFVPQEHVTAFREAMQATEVDWTLVQFGNAVHSFTDPQAAMPGRAEYHPEVAERSFDFMEEFFEELWDD
jgi:dienelactone hydrolase